MGRTPRRVYAIERALSVECDSFMATMDARKSTGPMSKLMTMMETARVENSLPQCGNLAATVRASRAPRRLADVPHPFNVFASFAGDFARRRRL